MKILSGVMSESKRVICSLRCSSILSVNVELVFVKRLKHQIGLSTILCVPLNRYYIMFS